MTQQILDCQPETAPEVTCTLQPYHPPPATVEHYTLGPTWWVPIFAAIVLAALGATAVVRYKAHEERGETERQRIFNPPKQCPTCGDKLETK